MCILISFLHAVAFHFDCQSKIGMIQFLDNVYDVYFILYVCINQK